LIHAPQHPKHVVRGLLFSQGCCFQPRFEPSNKLRYFPTQHAFGLIAEIDWFPRKTFEDADRHDPLPHVPQPAGQINGPAAKGDNGVFGKQSDFDYLDRVRIAWN